MLTEVLAQVSFDRLGVLVAAVHNDGVHGLVQYAGKPVRVV